MMSLPIPSSARGSRLGGVTLLVLLLALLAVSPLRGADAFLGFEAANRLYEEGKYNEAAIAYDQLVTAGQVSEAVYFNLGNARFKAGNVGRAIYNYRLAERLAPRDPDVLANLQFARNSVGTSNGETQTWWQARLGRLSLNEWAWWTMLPFWAWFTLLIIGCAQPAWRPALKNWTLLSGLATAVLLCLLIAAASQRSDGQDAVVTAREAVVRYGPLDESQSAYNLRDGAEVRILDEKGDWLQVSAGNRPTGWLKKDLVQRLPR